MPSHLAVRQQEEQALALDAGAAVHLLQVFTEMIEAVVAANDDGHHRVATDEGGQPGVHGGPGGVERK